MLDTSWLKLLTFFGLWAAIWLPIAGAIIKFIDWQPGQPLIPQHKLILLTSLYVLTPGIIAWKMRVESLSFASLGLNSTGNILKSILLGLTISLASVITIFCLESALSLVSWRWQNFKALWSLLLPILVLSLSISFIEELIFRGYVFSTLSVDNSYWLSATISSAIFALLHLVWERKHTIPQIPGLWLMGMILIAAKMVNGNSIYLAIGLHAGWIWSLTCIDSAQLITYNYRNHWITGLNQQPLGGFAGLFCLAITGLSLWAIGNYGLLWFQAPLFTYSM